MHDLSPTHDGKHRVSRRRWLGASGAAAAGWLTPVAETLARAAEAPAQGPAQSVIVLWLAGGPSQLETFDPHEGREIAAGSKSIATAVREVRLSDRLPRTAEQLGHLALVRNVVSKEGDHERGSYAVKTGYRPTPALKHATLGAIACHELPEQVPGLPRTEVPRHISIFPGPWPAWGGYFGGQYNAFKVYELEGRLPNLAPRVARPEFDRRVSDLERLEAAFAVGRKELVDRTRHRQDVAAARAMMDSDQVQAFDVGQETRETLRRFGDTPFGRGCLAARRLIERGVRCVEVTLSGWDTHLNNHESHGKLCDELDPALAALVADLRERGLWERTALLCGGEFGRTPRLNGAEGRDHWPHGFSLALGGGRIAGGTVVGETDPDGGKLSPDSGTPIADIQATLLAALGIDPGKIVQAGPRPMALSEGTPIASILRS